MRAARTHHRRLALATSGTILIALAGGLVAWISSEASQSNRVVSSSPAAVVKAAVAATRSAGTAEFEETITSSNPGSSEVSIGSVNFATNQWTMTTYNGTAGSSTKTAEIRVIGPTLYERQLQSIGPRNPGWVGSSQKTTGFDWVFIPLSNRDVTASYVGTSDVDGSPTHAYVVQVPAGTVGGKPFAAYEIRVWIDDQGRIREAAGTRPLVGETGTSTTTLRVSDFGVPVTVAVPTPLQMLP